MDEQSYIWHLKRLMVLGAPLVLAQMLQMSIGVTDSLMVGRLGELPLAQIGLGASFIFFFILMPMGLAIAVSVREAQALGRDQVEKVQPILRAGLWVHLIFFVLSLPMFLFAENILLAFGQQPEVVEGAVHYIYVVLISMPFVFVTNVIRSHLTALERGNQMLAIAAIGFFVNIIGNYILVFGHFGMPALGLIGSAIASVITNIMIAIVTLWMAYKDPMEAKVKAMRNWFVFEVEEVKKTAMIGLPISFGIISEVGLFQAATFLVGTISATALAAHTIVLQSASITFMIPLGLSIAASVRAGNAVGRADRDGLIKGALVAYGVVLMIMMITAILFWTIPETFVAMFQDMSRNETGRVLELAVTMFVGAALFQIVDGAQVVGISVLRGIQDVVVPSIMAFVAYWMIGFPAAYILGFRFGLDGQGVWFGLAIGLAVASVLMAKRLYTVTRPDAFAALEKPE